MRKGEAWSSVTTATVRIQRHTYGNNLHRWRAYSARNEASRCGFTMIELLVTVGIIGVLAGLLLPALRNGISEARRVACMNNLNQMGAGVPSYLQDSNEVFPLTDDPVSTQPYYWLWMGRGWRPIISPYLGKGNSTFWCPMDTDAVENYSSTSYAYSMSFYHSAEQIDAMNSAANTYSKPVASVPQYLARVRTPAKKILLGEWLSNHRFVEKDNGWWNWYGSRNFLFVDGHVEYLDTQAIRASK